MFLTFAEKHPGKLGSMPRRKSPWGEQSHEHRGQGPLLQARSGYKLIQKQL